MFVIFKILFYAIVISIVIVLLFIGYAFVDFYLFRRLAISKAEQALNLENIHKNRYTSKKLTDKHYDAIVIGSGVIINLDLKHIYFLNYCLY